MTGRVPSYVTVGIAAMTASAIAIAPTVAPPPDIAVSPKEPVVSQVSKARVELLAAVQRMTPTMRPEPAAAVTASAAPLNAASDSIVAAWNAVLPWIDYGVNLTDYVLGFIPGLSIIGDQVSIVYYSLVRPVANTFVVDLVAPVVNAPLNINSYVNGLVTLGSVTVTSLINLGISEFNYFFGWLIPPIPPITLAAQAAAADPTVAAMAAPATALKTAAAEATGAEAQVASPTEEVTADTEASPATAAPAHSKPTGIETTPDTQPANEPEKQVTPAAELTTSHSASASGTVQAQGEVRGAPNEQTTQSANISNNDKKGGKGPTTNAATESSADSSATTDNTGAKHDKGEKKDAIGKKE